MKHAKTATGALNYLETQLEFEFKGKKVPASRSSPGAAVIQDLGMGIFSSTLGRNWGKPSHTPSAKATRLRAIEIGRVPETSIARGASLHLAADEGPAAALRRTLAA